VKEKVGWIETELGQVCSKIVDGTHHTPEYTETGIPFISVKDIYNEKVSFRNCRHVSYETHRELIKRCCPEPNDLLITKSGTIGRMAIVPNKPEFSLFVSVALLKNYKSTIYSKFLLYSLENYLNSINISQDIKGGLLKNFHLEDIRITKINLAPLPEQRAIISKIELLFSELDNGIANLKLAQEQLKVYRQAVLKKAFEGELTRKWRKQQTGLPDAGDLLEQICREREKAAKASGKKVKPVKLLTEEELANLNRLPSEWHWVKIGDITLGVEYGTSAKSKESGDVVVLRMGNIQNGQFDWNDLVYTSDKAEIEKYLLRKDDVLFNRTNSPELVGKTAIYNGEKTAIFAGYLIRINQLPILVVADYLNYFLNCPIAKINGN